MGRQRNTPREREEDHRLGGFSFDRFYQLNRRALIWIILGILLYLMRSFFGLIFLTFVFAFIATPISSFFEQRLRLRRGASICLTYVVFLTMLVALVSFVVPQVAREAISISTNRDSTEAKLVELRNKLSIKYPNVEKALMNYLRSTIPDDVLKEAVSAAPDGSKVSASGREIAPSELINSTSAATTNSATTLAAAPVAITTDTATLELERAARRDEAVIHAVFVHQKEKLSQRVPDIIHLMWNMLGTIALALLFSFLISLDISRLEQEVRNLRASRLRDFHNEAAKPVVRFAYVVGRAIQAQAMIALVNTTLTLIGLMILGVPSLAVLSMTVFLCSFVPVLGVFISTVPIALVALNTGGLNLAALSVIMVIIAHAVEAYVLNPFIYGKHLKLNPVLVMLILFVGHHAFGVWGMLLGVPVAHYFIHDVFGVPVWSERRMARKTPPPDDPDPKPLTMPDDPVDL